MKHSWFSVPAIGHTTGALLALLGLALSACGGGSSDDSAPNAPSAVASSWSSAVVFLPNTTTQTNIAALADRPAAPVVVALHGCSGLGELPNWGPSLAALGYIVIMPDSLARSDRAGRFTCSGTSTGTGNLDIYDKRIEEAEYAISQIQGKPWFDGRHLLLLGQSEGGFTVARKTYAGITAAAVSGYWCSGTGGLAVASQVPTLTVTYDRDPFYYGQPGFTVPSCSGGVSGSNHVQLIGAFHGAFDTDAGRNAVLDFARTQAAR